jgi:N-acetylglucosaminyldiphosphoundecaprenol N-acetyl-beta-D-mannosaminyltransferase
MAKMRNSVKMVEAKVVKTSDKKAIILGVGVNSTSIDTVLNNIREICAKKDVVRPFIIVTANVEIIMLAQGDEKYKEIINSADLVTADSVGVVWASDGEITERVPGRKLVERLVRESGLKFFFLGGRNGVPRKMAEKYKGRWDGGEENIRAGERESGRIIAKINKDHPDVLLVAYGSPWETKWIWEHRNELKVKVAMGVGGTFDYLTGQIPLPPVWVEKTGLEWLWRLMRQPGRWRRQLNLIKFWWKVLTG